MTSRNSARNAGLGRYALLGIATVALGGCTIVDEKLYQGLDDEPPGPEGPELAEACERNPSSFQLDGGGDLLSLDTRDLDDDVDQRSGLSCTGKPAPGHDGFFAIEVSEGDTWHFHIAPDANYLAESGLERNPVLYILDSTCDVRNCPRGHDICGADSAEHFTYSVTDPGDSVIFLGVDDRLEGGGVYTLEAIKVDCASSERQHGKGCVAGSANCDELCRSILTLDEPVETMVSHAEFKSANVITFPEEAPFESRIRGALAGCEPDFYLAHVTEGQTLSAEIFTNGDDPCPDDAPPMALELFDADLRLLEQGETTAESGCPSLSRAGLAEGEYYLKISNGSTTEETVSFMYRFGVTLADPE